MSRKIATVRAASPGTFSRDAITPTVRGAVTNGCARIEIQRAIWVARGAVPVLEAFAESVCKVSSLAFFEERDTAWRQEGTAAIHKLDDEPTPEMTAERFRN